MKKTALILAILLVLLNASLIVGMQPVNVTLANASNIQLTQVPESKNQFELRVMQVYVYGKSCSFTYNITNVLGFSSFNNTVIEVYSVELFSDGNLLASKGQGFFIGDNLDSDTLFGLTSYIPYANSGISSINFNGSRLRSDSLQLSHSLTLQDLSGNVLLRVERLGLVIVEGESVSNTLSSGELVDQIELERHGDGFSYDALPETTIPTSPSPLPSEEPQQAGQDMTGAIFAVTSIIVFLSLLFYIIKRK
jgi:hypothetical protein